MGSITDEGRKQKAGRGGQVGSEQRAVGSRQWAVGSGQRAVGSCGYAAAHRGKPPAYRWLAPLFFLEAMPPIYSSTEFDRYPSAAVRLLKPFRSNTGHSTSGILPDVSPDPLGPDSDECNALVASTSSY